MAANESLYDLQRRYFEALVGAGVLAPQPAAVPSLSASSSALSGSNQSALTDRVLVKAAQGRVHSYNIFNPNASVAFVQLFNSASVAAVTLGATAPTDWLAVPAGGVLDGYWPNSPIFSAGIVMAATTTPTGGVLVTTGLPVSLGFV